MADPRDDPDEPPVKLTAESLRAAQWAVGYLVPYRVRMAWALGAQLCSTTLGLIFPYAAGSLIDAALHQAGSSGVNTIAVSLLGVLALQAGFSFVSSINLLTAVERA